jgi:hypothetical protein
LDQNEVDDTEKSTDKRLITCQIWYYHSSATIARTENHLMALFAISTIQLPDFPTSEPDQALDLTGLKLDCSLKSSCLIVINKPGQAEEEAGLSSLVSLSGRR